MVMDRIKELEDEVEKLTELLAECIGRRDCATYMPDDLWQRIDKTINNGENNDQ